MSAIYLFPKQVHFYKLKYKLLDSCIDEQISIDANMNKQHLPISEQTINVQHLPSDSI